MADTAVIDILINGVSRVTQFESISLNYSESAFCGSVSISGLAMTYWAAFDPAVNFGVLCISISIGSTTYKFLCEERNTTVNPSGVTFTVWGRSAQALLDIPYSKTIIDDEDTDYPWQTGSTTASSIITTVMNHCCSAYILAQAPVSWTALNYTINKDTFSTSNDSPISVISKLAQTIGAQLIANINGSLSIVPYSIVEGTPVLAYNDVDDIVELSDNIPSIKGYNSVVINGFGSGVFDGDQDEDTPILEMSVMDDSYGGWEYNVVRRVKIRHYHPDNSTLMYSGVNYGNGGSSYTKTGYDTVVETVQLTNGLGYSQYPDSNGSRKVTSINIPFAITTVTRTIAYIIKGIYSTVNDEDEVGRFSVRFADSSEVQTIQWDFSESSSKKPFLAVITPTGLDSWVYNQTKNVKVYSYHPDGSLISLAESKCTIGASLATSLESITENVQLTDGVGYRTYPNTVGERLVTGSFDMPLEIVEETYNTYYKLFPVTSKLMSSSLVPRIATATFSFADGTMSQSIQWGLPTANSFLKADVLEDGQDWTYHRTRRVKVYYYSPAGSAITVSQINATATLETTATESITEDIQFNYGVGNASMTSSTGVVSYTGTVTTPFEIITKTYTVNYKIYKVRSNLTANSDPRIASVAFSFANGENVQEIRWDYATANKSSFISAVLSDGNSEWTYNKSRTIKVFYYNPTGSALDFTAINCTITLGAIQSQTITEAVQLVNGLGNTSMPNSSGVSEVTGTLTVPFAITTVTYTVNYRLATVKSLLNASSSPKIGVAAFHFVNGECLQTIQWDLSAYGKNAYLSAQLVPDTYSDWLYNKPRVVKVYYYNPSSTVISFSEVNCDIVAGTIATESRTENIQLINGLGQRSMPSSTGVIDVTGTPTVPFAIVEDTYTVRYRPFTVTSTLLSTSTPKIGAASFYFGNFENLQTIEWGLPDLTTPDDALNFIAVELMGDAYTGWPYNVNRTVKVYYYGGTLDFTEVNCTITASTSGTESITEDVQLINGLGQRKYTSSTGVKDVTGTVTTDFTVVPQTYTVNYKKYIVKSTLQSTSTPKIGAASFKFTDNTCLQTIQWQLMT